MDQAELLRHVVHVLEDRQIAYMLVGSFASAAYGEPRFTQDIDLVVDLPTEQVANFCKAFPADEFYWSETAIREAIAQRRMLNLIHPRSGNKVDVIVCGTDDYSREEFSRRQRVTLIPDLDGWVAAPENVILGKLRYYDEGHSDKHLRDVAGIVRVTGPQLETAYIAEWCQRLGFQHHWAAVQQRLANDGPGT